MVTVNLKTGSETEVAPIDKQLLDACIHCGLCLPACPTYLATGREMESPRGRIYLLSQWNAGEQDLSPRLSEHIDSCLGCLGCQTACPSGVQYEKILNAARPHIAAMRPPVQRAIMRFSFRNVLPNYPLLHFFGTLLRWWQTLKLGTLLRFIAVPSQEMAEAGEAGTLVFPLRQLFYRLHIWESFLPRVPVFRPLVGSKASTNGETVQLFSGCVMDVFYNHVNRACQRLLEEQGKSVCIPEQGCCGALAMHAGEEDIARDLARKNIEYFEKTSGSIVVTAAGCGAMLKEYPELFHKEPQWEERAKKVAARSLDVTEALAEGKFAQVSQSHFKQQYGDSAAVAYHAACHLAHAQKVRLAPEALITQAAQELGSSLKLIPLREAEHCCGSAGIYNLLNTQLSMKVLERKMEFIQQSGANIIVTTNPGCMLQLDMGARRAGLSVTVLHLAEFLDSLYRK